MTKNQIIADLLRQKKWTELLRTIPSDEPSSLAFDTIEDMNSIRSVGWRMNTSRELDYTFSFYPNYELRTILVKPVPRT